MIQLQNYGGEQLFWNVNAVIVPWWSFMGMMVDWRVGLQLGTSRKIKWHKTSLRLMYDTPPKINMERENDGLEDDFLLPGVYSQVPC